MLKVSEQAKTKIESLLLEEGKNLTNCFVRVSVESGGCSGLSYKLTFDNVEKDGDKFFDSNGVRVVVDKRSFLYLVGTTLEYSGGLNGKGFSFVNPNAKRTCGCGESFAV